MEKERKFKTKSGYCSILNDVIILSEDAIKKNVFIILLCGVLSIDQLYVVYSRYQNEKFIGALLSGVLVLIFICTMINYLRNFGTSVIKRSKIKKVTLKKSIFGLIHSRFEVSYEKNNKIKKQSIMLPNSIRDQEKAIKIMTEEKYLFN